MKEIDYPLEFICPITQLVMKNPGITSDGHTYEHNAIRNWFNIGNNTSPITNLHLGSQSIIPNRALKNCIGNYKSILNNVEK